MDKTHLKNADTTLILSDKRQKNSLMYYKLLRVFILLVM